MGLPALDSKDYVAGSLAVTQINAITLGVKDLNRAKKFYIDGLGCTIDQDHPGFVSLKVGDSPVKLGLYMWDALAADAGVPADAAVFAAPCSIPSRTRP